MPTEKVNLYEKTIDHFLAPVVPFLRDPSVSEIMINRPDEIYVEKNGQVTKTDASFEDDEALMAAVNNVLQYTGKRLTQEHPLVDSRLPDGSRVHVILAPLSRRGTAMTIRKFAKVMFSAEHLLELGSWTEEVLEYVRTCVMAEKNVLVSGGTSSGKTCLLNVLSGFIPNHQRIVMIEDSAELEPQQDHVLSLESRPPDRWGRGEVTIRELFRSSLRLRPDRIIIGECRGGEALEIIQAMTSGHAGSMSTLHANSSLDALSRLETLAMMSKVELPLHALRSQVASAIDVVIQMTRFSDGRRGVTQVSEVLPLADSGQYRVQDMFSYQLKPGQEVSAGGLEWCGKKSIYRHQPKIRALTNEWNLVKKIFEESEEDSE
ncbi:MAG: CpaF family protein [Phycisphaerae bacterium]